MKIVAETCRFPVDTSEVRDAAWAALPLPSAEVALRNGGLARLITDLCSEWLGRDHEMYVEALISIGLQAARENGIQSVTAIRCMPHKDVPPLNRNEGMGECGVCERVSAEREWSHDA
jgi:hypothetical protein